MALSALTAGAVEEAAYTLVSRDGRFEIRDYAAMVVAETVVEGDRVSAGDQAFRPLFRYISADNRDGAQIPMTAPVTQTASGDQWAVAFVMPAASALERMPAPGEPAVTLREIPARRMAVVR